MHIEKAVKLTLTQECRLARHPKTKIAPAKMPELYIVSPWSVFSYGWLVNEQSGRFEIHRCNHQYCLQTRHHNSLHPVNAVRTADCRPL